MTKRRTKLERETLSPSLKAAFDIAKQGPAPQDFDTLCRKLDK